jgi:integrase
MSRYTTTDLRFWKARKKHYFEIIDNEDTKNIKRVSDNNIVDLVRKKDVIDEEIKNGVYGLDFISLGDTYNRYRASLEKRKNQPSTSTFNDYDYCAKQLWTIKIKNTFIKNIHIGDFTVPDLNLINVHMNENFSVRSNKQSFNLLTRLFKYALNYNLGNKLNPCREVDRDEFKAIKKDYDQSLGNPVIVQGGFDESLKKINGLLDKLKSWNFQHYVMVRLMCELGGRCGEVLPLMIHDYNYGSNTIDINKTVNTGNNELHHQTKTSTGMRTVALSDDMGDLIKQLIMQHKPETKLLFPSSRNTIIQGNNFSNRILNKFNKELGVVGRINPHSFRVFVITLRDYLEHKKKNIMADAGHGSKQISDHYVRGKWVNFDKNREDQNEIAGFLN